MGQGSLFAGNSATRGGAVSVRANASLALRDSAVVANAAFAGAVMHVANDTARPDLQARARPQKAGFGLPPKGGPRASDGLSLIEWFQHIALTSQTGIAYCPVPALGASTWGSGLVIASTCCLVS